MDLSRPPTSGLPQTPISATAVSTPALRPQSNSIMSPTSMPPTLGAPPSNSISPINKSGKKQRKDGEPEPYRDRSNVQSPAYSDISDDSSPVGEPDIGGKENSQIIMFFFWDNFIHY